MRPAASTFIPPPPTSLTLAFLLSFFKDYQVQESITSSKLGSRTETLFELMASRGVPPTTAPQSSVRGPAWRHGRLETLFLNSIWGEPYLLALSERVPTATPEPAVRG